jgi:16S rRNA (guanine966-N2)-methyltransferase
MRVIAGRLKGRLIEAPAGLDIRPTYDRVRESLFSMIGSRTTGAQVLDLFAGTGSLGIEALSRGASRATFVEKSTAALALLKINVRRLDLGGSSAVTRGDVIALLSCGRIVGGPFDLIFLDPPYGAGLADRTLALLGEWDGTSDDCLVAVERGTRDALRDSYGRLSRSRSRRYGGTMIDLFERAGSPSPREEEE